MHKQIRHARLVIKCKSSRASLPPRILTHQFTRRFHESGISHNLLLFANIERHKPDYTWSLSNPRWTSLETAKTSDLFSFLSSFVYSFYWTYFQSAWFSLKDLYSDFDSVQLNFLYQERNNFLRSNFLQFLMNLYYADSARQLRWKVFLSCIQPVPTHSFSPQSLGCNLFLQTFLLIQFGHHSFLPPETRTTKTN